MSAVHLLDTDKNHDQAHAIFIQPAKETPTTQKPLLLSVVQIMQAAAVIQRVFHCVLYRKIMCETLGKKTN
jgi:hypothetical protein